MPAGPSQPKGRNGPAGGPSDFRSPLTLSGRWVALVPLEPAHVPGLARAGRDPEVWRLLRIGPGGSEAETRVMVAGLLEEQRQGEVLPFTIFLRGRATPLGVFRYLHIGRYDRKVEIGTWLDREFWRTPVNTEVKYLGLAHAFGTERYHRVEMRTDARNERSRISIERLGAHRDGVHRGHYTLRDGTHRTSLVYSLLAAEWPAVKAALASKLERRWPGPPAPSPVDRGASAD